MNPLFNLFGSDKIAGDCEWAVIDGVEMAIRSPGFAEDGSALPYLGDGYDNCFLEKRNVVIDTIKAFVIKYYDIADDIVWKWFFNMSLVPGEDISLGDLANSYPVVFLALFLLWLCFTVWLLLRKSKLVNDSKKKS